MRRAFLPALFVAALIAGLPSPAVAATATGRVVMGTSGARLPEGLRVTVLQNNDQGIPEGQPSFVPVAPDGAFSFEADPARGHLIGLFFSDVAYSAVLEPGRTGPVEIRIYETTTDASVVRVASDSMTVLKSTAEGQGNVLEVLQLLRFRNDSDRTYIGSEPGQTAPEPAPSPGGPPQPPERQVLKLPVPESAYDLAPAGSANGAGLATSGSRLVTTSALAPGETSVAYLYKVKVPRTGWQLRRETYFPTDQADLLVGRRLNLTAAPGFEFQESKTLGGESYKRYRSGELNPGSVIEADIGYPAEAVDGVWIGFGAGVAVLASLLVATTVRMRRRRAAKAQAKDAASTPAPEPEAAAEPSRQELIDRVAALDEEFEAGGLEAPEYESQRKSLLAKLSSSPDS